MNPAPPRFPAPDRARAAHRRRALAVFFLAQAVAVPPSPNPSVRACRCRRRRQSTQSPCVVTVMLCVGRWQSDSTQTPVRCVTCHLSLCLDSSPSAQRSRRGALYSGLDGSGGARRRLVTDCRSMEPASTPSAPPPSDAAPPPFSSETLDVGGWQVVVADGATPLGSPQQCWDTRPAHMSRFGFM